MTKYISNMEHSIIARLDLPKQRATAPLSVILIANEENGIVSSYSTHLLNRETNSTFSGHYDFENFAKGMQSFKERCERFLAYAPEVYEDFDK